jgi:hypothetical protein
LAASMFGMLITVDRWIVLGLYGNLALGQFSLASMGLVGLLMIPALVSQQHLARTAHRFGQDGDPEGLRRRARSQGILALAITLPAALALLAAAFAGIPAFLPDYRSALAPLAIASGGAVVYAALSGYPNVLGLARRGTSLVVIQSIALVSLVPIAVATAALGLGLAGIAFATALVLAGYGAATAIASRSIDALDTARS